MIIAAADFSSDDMHTLACAASMARLRGEPLLLVHVVGRKGERPDGHLPSTQRLAEMVGDAQLSVSSEKLDIERDVVSSLTALAERVSAQLVVVGDQGAPDNGAEHAASRLSRRLSCPLLVAGRDGALATRRYSERPLRVLVPCDMTEHVDAAVSVVRELRATTALHCEVVNYYWPAIEWDRTASMRRLVGEDEWSFRAEATTKSVGAAIAADSWLREYDLIVLSTRQRGAISHLFHASVREALLKASSVPLLLAPARLRASLEGPDVANASTAARRPRTR